MTTLQVALEWLKRDGWLVTRSSLTGIYEIRTRKRVLFTRCYTDLELLNFATRRLYRSIPDRVA